MKVRPCLPSAVCGGDVLKQRDLHHLMRPALCGTASLRSILEIIRWILLVHTTAIRVYGLYTTREPLIMQMVSHYHDQHESTALYISVSNVC